VIKRLLNGLILSLLLTVSWGLTSENAWSRTRSESFTSRENLDSAGGMVWNIGRGELHPPLEMVAWDDAAFSGPYTTPFSVGDGHHGAFVSSRYAIFDRNGVVTGGVIEIDTDVYTELEFTTFRLEASYTIRPVGANPLIIRSQTGALIEGVIDCRGDDGATAVSAVSTVLAGGAGRCGGGDGGASVAAGVSPDATNKGGAGGAGAWGGDGGPICLASGGQGGGGGGAYLVSTGKSASTHGDNSAAGAGGLAGAVVNTDDGFTADIDGAGAGGGGGSAFDDVLDPTHHSSGASGGGGGGNVRIYAVEDVEITGTGAIYVDGGAGGAVGGGLKGGGGGGGGGGSVLIFAGEDIVTDGPVTAAPGLGGVTAGGDGGNGSWGRTWLSEKDGFASGGVPEDPGSELSNPGNARYETGVTYTLTSKAIDVGNTHPTILAVPMTIANLGGSTLIYELDFSDSSSLATLATFALASTFVGVEVERYARFRIQIDNTSATTPVRIEDLSLTYDGVEENDFGFVTGCGGIQNNGASSGGQGAWWMVLFLLPIAILLPLRAYVQARA
jgi:hypothetical protein